MDKELDLIAINLVAKDGHRMPLKKEDRFEAIKLMTELGITRQVMAARLCIKVEALERFARDKNFKLPLTIPPAHWTVEYIDSRTKETRRERRRARESAAKQT